jgi:esterase/lipase
MIRFFITKLKKIPETILTKKEKVVVAAKFQELEKKFDYKVVLEIADVHGKNFMIDKNKADNTMKCKDKHYWEQTKQLKQQLQDIDKVKQ